MRVHLNSGFYLHAYLHTSSLTTDLFFAHTCGRKEQELNRRAPLSHRRLFVILIGSVWAVIQPSRVSLKIDLARVNSNLKYYSPLGKCHDERSSGGGQKPLWCLLL